MDDCNCLKAIVLPHIFSKTKPQFTQLTSKKESSCNVYPKWTLSLYEISVSSHYTGNFWWLSHPTLHLSCISQVIIKHYLLILQRPAPHLHPYCPWRLLLSLWLPTPSSTKESFWTQSLPFLGSSLSFWLAPIFISSSQSDKEEHSDFVHRKKVLCLLSGPGAGCMGKILLIPWCCETEYIPYGQDLQRILQLNS